MMILWLAKHPKDQFHYELKPFCVMWSHCGSISVSGFHVTFCLFKTAYECACIWCFCLPYYTICPALVKRLCISYPDHELEQHLECEVKFNISAGLISIYISNTIDWTFTQPCIALSQPLSLARLALLGPVWVCLALSGHGYLGVGSAQAGHVWDDPTWPGKVQSGKGQLTAICEMKWEERKTNYVLNMEDMF